ncbi:MAG TPA: HYR domain-containing protein [Blastocatellia bacterium]|nr:HYR domain-containing protein [Blastocatellia bacterium]
MSQVKAKSRTVVAVVLPLILLAILMAGRAGGARAHSAAAMRPETFLVTNRNDSGEGSLRDAINQANMTAGPDTIEFDEATWGGTITLTSGELLITDDLTITGPGAFTLTVSGNHQSRVFEINSQITVDISGLTISDGMATTGGGVLNNGMLDLRNVVLSGNTAPGDGGGIYNAGTLTIDISTLAGNSATGNGGDGGGIYNAGTLTITNSTLSGNSASIGDGGGIYNADTLTITNSTLSGNSASIGGGIRNAGTANISFTTISNNSADSLGGGGIANNIAATINIKNSIVANSTSGGNCAGAGTYNVSGVNFSTDSTCPGFTQVPSTGPGGLNLGPLADNGGPTQTHALLPNSVAIDAAPDCTDLNGTTNKTKAPQDVVTTDQRGIGRPQGNACDAGAYEFVPCTTQPSIFCPENFTVSTDANQCAAKVDYTLPPADCPCSNGGGAKSTAPKGSTCSVSCSPPPGSNFPRGTTTVTCTVTDVNSNTAMCSFSITVTDQVPPALSCPASVTQSTDPNQCQATVTYTATATDNCDGPRPVTCMPPSGSTFQKGTTTVTCTASDTSGNTATCMFLVTVNDTQPPSITCPASMTIVVPVGTTCTVVTYPPPKASDNCPGVTTSCTPPSGSCFPRGTTTVNCTATDTSGNTASCSFRVSSFDLCLQDDANPTTVVLVNTSTGDYRFCCNGTTFTGRGKLTVRGSIYTLEHSTTDRRVLVTDDESQHRGTASLQVPPGTTRCTITDRDTRNNTCQCQ